MVTFDKALEICKRNAQSAGSAPKTIWTRATATSMVSTDNRFRITRLSEKGAEPLYFAEHCATSTSAARPIGGQFAKFEDAKAAVEFWK